MSARRCAGKAVLDMLPSAVRRALVSNALVELRSPCGNEACLQEASPCSRALPYTPCCADGMTSQECHL